MANKQQLKPLIEYFVGYGNVNRYKFLNTIGSGTYGTVYSALDTDTNEKVAIKKISNIFRNNGAAVVVLREIKLLRLLQHPHIVEIKSILVPPSSVTFEDIYVVLELMDADLHDVIDLNKDMPNALLIDIMYKILSAVKFMHAANVYHLDLKPQNILMNENDTLKICDFGLARAAIRKKPSWTGYIVTRWYRPPEICGSLYSKYTYAIDIWCIGCIFAELMLRKPLFPGKNDTDQLDMITDLLGTPSENTISEIQGEETRKYLRNMCIKSPVPFAEKFPNSDPQAIQLLQKLLVFDPRHRLTAEEVLADTYFKDLEINEEEPSLPAISRDEFEFENPLLTMDKIRELMYREILEHHPQTLQDHLSQQEDSNFTYPRSALKFRAIPSTGPKPNQSMIAFDPTACPQGSITGQVLPFESSSRDVTEASVRNQVPPGQLTPCEALRTRMEANQEKPATEEGNIQSSVNFRD